MGKYLLKRFLILIPVAIIISFIMFTIIHSMPGDPIAIAYGDQLFSPEMAEDPEKTQAFLDRINRQYGYDKPIPTRYLRWVGNAFKGDFGRSSQYKTNVNAVIKEPLKLSIVINIISLVISFVLAVMIGIRSAVKRYSLYDAFNQVTSLIFMSMPTFFIGLSLILIFPVKLGWLEFGGLPVFTAGTSVFERIWQYIRHLTLPIMTLTIGSLAGVIRYVRGSMIDVLKQDFIKTARSKGLSEKVIIYSHAFRNAMIPVVTILAGSLVGIFGGSAITEQVFAINGIGRVLINALNVFDFNVVLTMNMFYAILSLLANVVMDVSYALVDPRVKLG